MDHHDFIQSEPLKLVTARLERGSSPRSLARPLIAACVAFLLVANFASAAESEPSAEEIESLVRDRQISEVEAAERLRWQSGLVEIDRTARENFGERFSGVWVDPGDGDRIKVGVRMAQARDFAALGADLSRMRMDRAVDLVNTRFSLRELSEVNEWVANEIVALGGGHGISAGLRTDLNRVEIELHSGHSESAMEVLQRAQAAFGDAVSTRSSEAAPTTLSCTYPYCDPSLRGGNRIFNRGRGCTSAFVARSKVDAKLYQFTAGHCVSGGFGGNWSTRFTDNSVHVIGPRHNSIFGARGDMAILRINNPSGWRPENWVHVTSGPDTTVNETYAISSEGYSYIGMRICATGASLGRSDCGEVTQLGYTANYPERTVKNLGRASICSVRGDSGAPLYASHTAYGILSGGWPGRCDTLYQGIQGAESAMNVNVLH